MEFVSTPDNYKDLWQPANIAASTLQAAIILFQPGVVERGRVQ